MQLEVNEESLGHRINASLPKGGFATVATFANHIDCHTATIWRNARRDPNFPQPVRIHGLTRWRVSDIEAYLNRVAEAA